MYCRLRIDSRCCFESGLINVNPRNRMLKRRREGERVRGVQRLAGFLGAEIRHSGYVVENGLS